MSARGLANAQVMHMQAMQRALDCDFTIPDQPCVSDDAKDMIRRLLVRDPGERASIDDVMRHAFFRTDLPRGALELNDHILTKQASMTLTMASPERSLCETVGIPMFTLSYIIAHIHYALLCAWR